MGTWTVGQFVVAQKTSVVVVVVEIFVRCQERAGFGGEKMGREERRGGPATVERLLLLLSHPILVTLSFLTARWRLYRVTALFLGWPTLSALSAEGSSLRTFSHVRVFRTRTILAGTYVLYWRLQILTSTILNMFELYVLFWDEFHFGENLGKKKQDYFQRLTKVLRFLSECYNWTSGDKMWHKNNKKKVLFYLWCSIS